MGNSSSERNKFRCSLKNLNNFILIGDIEHFRSLNNSLKLDLNFDLEKKKLIKVVDLLGRETAIEVNKLLLYMYSDGTIEKKIIIE